MESKAFDEFLAKRCEEILENDEFYININHDILKIEQELLPLLTHEALNKFLKIDELSIKLINRICKLCTDNFTIIRQIYDNF